MSSSCQHQAVREYSCPRHISASWLPFVMMMYWWPLRLLISFSSLPARWHVRIQYTLIIGKPKTHKHTRKRTQNNACIVDTRSTETLGINKTHRLFSNQPLRIADMMHARAPLWFVISLTLPNFLKTFEKKKRETNREYSKRDLYHSSHNLLVTQSDLQLLLYEISLLLYDIQLLLYDLHLLYHYQLSHLEHVWDLYAKNL